MDQIMSGNRKTAYAVEVIGFNQTERIVLASIFGLSARREPKFLQHANVSYAPDMYLVDGSDTQAVALFKARNANMLIPGIFIGDSSHGTSCAVLARPLQWTKLFRAFDQALAHSAPATPPAPPAAPSPMPFPAFAPIQTSPMASGPQSIAPQRVVPQSIAPQSVLPIAARMPHTAPVPPAAPTAPVAPAHVSAPAAAPARPAPAQAPASVPFHTAPVIARTGPTATVMPMPTHATTPAPSSAPQARQNNTGGFAPVPRIEPQKDVDWVLVVDDNLTVREFMKSKLAPFNFNVDYASSGEEAVGFTGSKHYTCVFLDVIMPGIDGYQVCKLIKSKRATTKTAVVMLTSKGSPFDKIRGAMAGCDAYLTKPVDEDKLLQTIVRFLPTH
jgi:CheY-like chemotaxis protein